MSKESALWKWLSNARNELRDQVDLRRVEDAIGAGFPDVDGLLMMLPEHSDSPDEDPFGFKLELKSEPRPKRASTPIRFALEKRRAQIEFMRKRYTMGEAAYFLVQVGESAEAMRYLVPGDCGQALREGMAESEIAVLCATENGMVFNKTVKPATVITRIRTCYKRRFFRR